LILTGSSWERWYVFKLQSCFVYKEYQMSHRLVFVILRLGLWLCVLPALMVMGCAPAGDETTASDQDAGTQISLVLPRQAQDTPPLTDIACIVVRVTAPDLQGTRGAVAAFPPGATQIEITVDVPAGANRRFEAEAFTEPEACDEQSIAPAFVPNFIPLLRTSGEVVEDVTPSGTTVVITMETVTGPVVRPPTLPLDTDGTAVQLQIIAFSPDNSPLTFSAADLPPGLSIDPATGLITGTLLNNASVSSPYTVNVTISDGTNLDSVSFPWTVNNPEPVLTLPFTPENNVSEGQTIALQPEASDPDSDPLTFSATGLPPGLAIDPATGLIAGTLSTTAAAGSPYTVTVTVADALSTSSLPFTLLVSNPPPVVTNPGDQSNNEGSVVALQIEAGDPDGDPLTFSATGLPANLTINTTTGQIAGTIDPTASAGSPYTVTVAVSDGTDTSSIMFIWEVGSVIPTIAINDRTIPENDATGAVFTVSLSTTTGQVVTVAVATANDSATAGSDYEATSATLTFSPGTATQTFTVPILNDALDESPETFLVDLSMPANATLADAQGVGTIQDDDAPPTLAINDVTINEGNSGTTNATFTITLSAPSGQPVTVNFATDNGTAAAGQDYQAANGNVVFPPGSTSQSITIAVVGDTLDEADQENFVVNLSAPTNATLADDGGVGTIRDDDAPPTLAINDVAVTEGNSGTTNATFTVTLSVPSGRPVTVNFATDNGTAVAEQDYQAARGTLTFPPGVTTQTLDVPVIGDTLDELDQESFVVNLSAPTNATLADAQGVGTIRDDDALPTLAINDVTVPEGSGGLTNATFTVTLSAPSNQPVTVDFATDNGTAVAGEDYQAASGTLTFPPGVTTQTLVVPIIGDTSDEADQESFVVNLGAPTNATLADAQGVGTIQDDDVLPTLAIDNVTVTEGNSETATATFTVTLSAASGQPVTVDFATADESAIAAQDYQATSGTLTFPPGVLTQTLNVSVIGDTLVEPDETFLVNLSNAAGATIATAQGVGTIVNDDVNLLLASQESNEILRFDAQNGAFLGALVQDDPNTPDVDESGSLQDPAGIAFGPANDLYVTSQGSNEVLRFDAQNGTFLGTLVKDDLTTPDVDESGGLQDPTSITFGPDGQLYVISHGSNQILRYDTQSGDFLGAVVRDEPATPDVDESGGLLDPTGITFGPDGQLYVISHGSNQILRYDTQSGDFLGAVVRDEPATPDVDESGGLLDPTGITFGPDGQLYVSSLNTGEILRYEAQSGVFLGVFVLAADGGLEAPGQLAFGPDGQLYVSDLRTHAILRYDGKTGAFLDIYVAGDTAGAAQVRQISAAEAEPVRQMSFVFMRPQGSGKSDTTP
jgi:hypothetical protein